MSDTFLHHCHEVTIRGQELPHVASQSHECPRSIADLAGDGHSSRNRLGRFESPSAALRADPPEERRQREPGPDARIAQRLERVLQFVANRAHELAARRTTGVDDDPQQAIRPGYLD